ncbi:hypothetical protein ACIQLG_19805 [Terribacillus saccharophilus]|uniref:hypothetical protein n=1 Tax=Terribacillus saccharophilus TaxID=361277 RepID=UPI003824B783
MYDYRLIYRIFGEKEESTQIMVADSDKDAVVNALDFIADRELCSTREIDMDTLDIKRIGKHKRNPNVKCEGCES